MKKNLKILDSVDVGIRGIVKVLIENNVETFESCQGGKGHCFFEPTVRFHGNQAEGYRAFSVALYHGFKVLNLRRYWSVEDGELKGAWWEMTFLPTKQ